MATFATLTPAQKTAAAQQIIASNPTYKFYNPAGLIAAAASNGTIANLIGTTATATINAAKPATTTAPAVNILPDPAKATQQSMVVNGVTYQLSPAQGTQAATWVTKSPSNAGLFKVDLTGKMVGTTPLYINQADYATKMSAIQTAAAKPPATTTTTAPKTTTTTTTAPTTITGATPPAALKLPDAATAVSLINQRAATAPPTMKTDSATGISYYLVPPSGSQPARWEAVSKGSTVSNNGLTVTAMNQAQTTYFAANQTKLPTPTTPAAPTTPTTPTVPTLTAAQQTALASQYQTQLSQATTQDQFNSIVAEAQAKGAPINQGYIDRFQTALTQKLAANTQAAVAAAAAPYLTELSAATTQAQINDILSRARNANVTLNQGQVDQFTAAAVQKEQQAQAAALQAKTVDYNNRMASATSQQAIDDLTKQAQAEGVTINPASVQQAQNQIKSTQEQLTFASKLGEPTGFTQTTGPNGQEYVSIAADPITGQAGGWYKVVGNDLQRVGSDGQATGAIIPASEFNRMKEIAQTNVQVYNKQISEQQAAQQLAADRTSFEAALPQPGSDQWNYLLANRFPMTGPGGVIYEPVAADLKTGASAQWMVSNNQGQTYKPLGSAADAPSVSKADINAIFTQNAEIQNQKAWDDRNALIAQQQEALAKKGEITFFSDLDDFINKTVGWKTIATIIGSAVGGPLGATLANATAGAIKGESLADIARGAALTFALTYGTQALSDALSQTAQTGADMGIEGFDQLATDIDTYVGNAPSVPNVTQVFDDGSVLITDAATGAPVGGFDIGGAEFAVNDGIATYIDSGLPLGGAPESFFGGSEITAPEVPVEAPTAVEPVQPAPVETTVPEQFGPPVEAMEPVVPEVPAELPVEYGPPVEAMTPEVPVEVAPTTPPSDVTWSDIQGQEVDLTPSVGGEPTVYTNAPVAPEVPVTAPVEGGVDWSQVPNIDITGTATNAIGSMSGVPAEVIEMANATLDPIAAVNAAMGWTASDLAYLAAIGVPASVIATAGATNAALGVTGAEVAGAGTTAGAAEAPITTVFDDGSILITDSTTGAAIGGADATGAEFVVNNGVAEYAGGGALGGTPEVAFGGSVPPTEVTQPLLDYNAGVTPPPTTTTTPVEPVPTTTGAPVEDLGTRVLTPEQVEAVTAPGTLGDWVDLAKTYTPSFGSVTDALSAANTLGGVVGGLIGSKPPTMTSPYAGQSFTAASPDARWTGSLIPAGAIPSYIGVQAQKPMYNTTSPVQSQYYWGTHPYVAAGGNLNQYQNVPSAPAQPWGLQQAFFDVPRQPVAPVVYGPDMTPIQVGSRG